MMQFVRAQAESVPAGAARVGVQTALDQVNLQTIAQHMYDLMLRNVSSDGFVVSDPLAPGSFSTPGCVIAAPSYPADLSSVNQNYIFNWMRDAALTAVELAAANIPERPGAGGVQPLIDYVNFAATCQRNATPTMSHACFTIEGQSRPWSEQSDGPALQSLAMLQAFPQLDAATQATATAVINKNVEYLLTVYQDATTNLWEEKLGYSFFARSAQLRCFEQITTNTLGIPVPAGTAAAITWLRSALQSHWNGTYYVTILYPPAPGAPPPAAPLQQSYDPNIDIVQAAIYGAVPVTDTKLLATAALLHSQWSDSSSPSFYPINGADASIGVGPMFGRYPGDTYDGDTNDHVVGGHPWALCTANFAELYYRLANAITESKTVPLDALSTGFFGQLAITAATTAEQAVAALQSAGDAMLGAIIHHSDNLELSEQFDGTSGYEKSVRDLTWSYGAFLSAVRAKTGQGVRG
ncbi:MAG: glycoside hydrolase family 15 protein [Solirubrobacteraceae bacterium]